MLKEDLPLRKISNVKTHFIQNMYQYFRGKPKRYILSQLSCNGLTFSFLAYSLKSVRGNENVFVLFTKRAAFFIFYRHMEG